MNRLRVAVIGAGHLGRIHARLARRTEGIAVVAVVDPQADARGSLGTELGLPAYESIDPLLESVDAAIVATPTFTHHQVSLPLLRRGIHLLVEKPLAVNVAEADELVAAAEQSGAVLQVGHVERFNPALAAALPYVAEPKYIEAARYGGYTFRSTDIGVVLDLMIHDLDVVLSLVASPVIRVDALGCAVVGEHEDVATARIEFGNGAVAQLNASRVSYESDRRMHIWTAQGFVAINFAQRTARRISADPQRIRTAMDPAGLSAARREQLQERFFEEVLPLESLRVQQRNAIADEQADFVAAIRSGTSPRVSGRQGRDVVAVAQEILEAIQRHSWDGTPAGRSGPHFQAERTILTGPHWHLSAEQAAEKRAAG